MQPPWPQRRRPRRRTAATKVQGRERERMLVLPARTDLFYFNFISPTPLLFTSFLPNTGTFGGKMPSGLSSMMSPERPVGSQTPIRTMEWWNLQWWKGTPKGHLVQPPRLFQVKQRRQMAFRHSACPAPFCLCASSPASLCKWLDCMSHRPHTALCRSSGLHARVFPGWGPRLNLEMLRLPCLRSASELLPFSST